MNFKQTTVTPLPSLSLSLSLSAYLPPPSPSHTRQPLLVAASDLSEVVEEEEEEELEGGEGGKELKNCLSKAMCGRRVAVRTWYAECTTLLRPRRLDTGPSLASIAIPPLHAHT